MLVLDVGGTAVRVPYVLWNELVEARKDVVGALFDGEGCGFLQGAVAGEDEGGVHAGGSSHGDVCGEPVADHHRAGGETS